MYSIIVHTLATKLKQRCILFEVLLGESKLMQLCKEVLTV